MAGADLVIDKVRCMRSTIGKYAQDFVFDNTRRKTPTLEALPKTYLTVTAGFGRVLVIMIHTRASSLCALILVPPRGASSIDDARTSL